MAGCARRWLAAAACLVLGGVLARPAEGAVIHVDADAAAGANNGTSWADAYTDLQSALAVATSADEIWVAEGTYKPTSGADRTISFALVDGVALYGGFAATESARGDRDWTAHETILSGDIGVAGDSSDNSYHVVVGVSNARLDGFTVTGGRADGAGSYENMGAGMLNLDDHDLVVANCSFAANEADSYGAGINSEQCTGLVVSSCRFAGNMAGTGAGLKCRICSVTISECEFISNSSSFVGGGIDLWWCSSTEVTNCVFAFNTAADRGGGAQFASSQSTVSNCTFYGNSSACGGAANAELATVTMTNCILWANTASVSGPVLHSYLSSRTTVARSCVEGGWPGVSNIDADPLLVDPAGGDFRLQAGSPCIDAADGDAAPPLDKDGSARRDDPGTANRGSGAVTYADIGACEFQGTTAGKWVGLGAPHSGTAWAVGQEMEIIWSASSSIFAVKIELSRSNGATWETLTGGTLNDGSFTWTVTDGGQAIPQADCLARVSDVLDGTTTDTSPTFVVFSGVWYVDAGAPAGGGGFSWSTAFQHPQDAVDASQHGHEIWVAGGTYTRRSAGDIMLLKMREGVSLHGGFSGTPGTEGVREARDLVTYTTMLDGEGLCRNVVGGAQSSRLEGFKVSGGAAFGGNYYYGGGLFAANVGGLAIDRCVFAANAASYAGAAYFGDCSAEVSDCLFEGNYANSVAGASWSRRANLVYRNCTFAGNRSKWGWGAVRHNESTVTVVNCVFRGNSGGDGPDIGNVDSSCTVSYTCTGQAGGFTDGGGNINADPLFVAPGSWDPNGTPADIADDLWIGGDYHLQAGSPCIDAADGDAATATDGDGLLRVDDLATPNTGVGAPPYVDMGAHELDGASAGTVTGAVILEDDVDLAQITIKAGSQTASTAVVGNAIQYTIAAVPGTTTQVVVTTSQAGYEILGSPAAIIWVGTDGYAAHATVRGPAVTPFAGGCAPGAGGAMSVAGLVVSLLALCCRRRTQGR